MNPDAGTEELFWRELIQEEERQIEEFKKRLIAEALEKERKFFEKLRKMEENDNGWR